MQPAPLARGPDRPAPAAAQPAGPRHVHTGPWCQALLPAPLTAGVTPPSPYAPLINGRCCCLSLTAALRRAGGGRLGWLCGRETAADIEGRSKPGTLGGASGRHRTRAGAGVERRRQWAGRRRGGRAPMSGRSAQAQARRLSAEQPIGIPAPPSPPGPPVLPRYSWPGAGGRGSPDPVGRGDSGLGPRASSYHKGVPSFWGLFSRFLELAPRSPSTVGGNCRRVPSGAPASAPFR